MSHRMTFGASKILKLQWAKQGIIQAFLVKILREKKKKENVMINIISRRLDSLNMNIS